MFQVKVKGFQTDYEFENAKRDARKEDRRRRDARKGKRGLWEAKAA